MFCAAITDSGEGIYHVPSFAPVLGPSFVKINHLFVRDDKIYFTSGRTGVNELYSLNSGGVLQHTCLQAGGQDFTFGEDGRLYFTYLRSNGRMVCRTPVDSLPVRRVDFSEKHRYELEDKLTAQEAALASDEPAEEPFISEPKRYSKLAHAIKIHSWLPFYADYDELESMSFESLTTALGLGATAFFQNDLNTLYGSVGYSYVPGVLVQDSLSLYTGVIDVTYRGLYPVFEGRVAMNRAFTRARLRSYVPLNFNSDGWSRAIIPIAEVSYSPTTQTASDGRIIHELTATAGIRAYSVLPTLNSCYFPRLGIGASVGVSKIFDFDPALPFASIYGYLPGLWKTSGLGLSLSYSTEPFTNETATKSMGVSLATTELRANYAIPFLSVDWNGLSPLMYIRNFEFIPKGSFTHYNLIWDPARVTPSGGPTAFNMWTAGAAFDVVLGNFWFIPYNIRVGASAVYVNGNLDPEAKPYEINLILNIDL